jgi:hypothetical protein
MDRKYIVVAIVGSLPFALWWGVPTYNKAKADAMVDELCAKDGGIRVYESVVLPADRFDRNGIVNVPNIKYKKPNDEYYYTNNTTWIVQKNGDPNDLVIWRDQIELYRISDGKKLGTATYYARRGGDPPSPMHPSSYMCPKSIGLEKKIFVKN